MGLGPLPLPKDSGAWITAIVKGSPHSWFTLVLIFSKPVALPDSFLKTQTHLLAAKNRLGVCETESRLTLEAQAYGRSDSYQAGLEARTPSALGAGTESWQLRTQQHLEAAAGGGWRMLFREGCFQAELCRMTLSLVRTASRGTPKAAGRTWMVLWGRWLRRF